ncbi:MAG: GNAT family N-acetyltransferase [Oscillospiraceae bacterium]|nr:GNAT family N-acetyltransferase [Oscillospiraceae bacterium]
MMKKLCISEYASAERFIRPEQCGAIYAYSIAQGYQHGDVYADEHSALLWHHCGFALLCGAYDTDTLNEIYEMFLSEKAALPRRFVLFAENTVADFYSKKSSLILEQRYFYEYPDAPPPQIIVPDPFRVQTIDGALTEKICGRITPSFSWDSAAAFLSNGKGYCVTDGDIPASWSFSAAVSDTETDIGIETAAAYQRRGLAKIAASALLADVIAAGKKPVWACHAGNQGSQRLASSLGYVRTAACCTVRRE